MKRILLLFTFLMVIKGVTAQTDTNSYVIQYNTTAHQLLALEENYSNLRENEKRNFYDSKYRKLDELMDAAKWRLKGLIKNRTSLGEDDVIHIFNTIDSVLTEQYFIVCIKEEKLSDALSPKKLGEFTCSKYLTDYRAAFCQQNPASDYFGIDCDLGAFLYISIGEVLELPISMVEVPGHNFVRFNFTGKSYINWDNNSGRIFTDNDFRKGLTPTINKSFTHKEEKLNHYLQSMSQYDVKGYYLSLIAIFLSSQNRKLEAEQLYTQAIAYRPYDALSSNNLSWMYLTTPSFQNNKIYRKAYKLSTQVNKQLPNDREYNDTYSCACAAIGKFEKAIQIEKTAYNKTRRIEGYRLNKTCLELGEETW